MKVQHVIGHHRSHFAELLILTFIEVGNQLGGLLLIEHRSHQTLSLTSGAIDAKKPEVSVASEKPHIFLIVPLPAHATLYIGDQSLDKSLIHAATAKDTLRFPQIIQVQCIYEVLEGGKLI